MKIHNIVFCLFLLLPFPVKAAVVNARVDRNEINLSESIELVVSVGDESARVDVSTIKDFKTTSRGTSTNIQIVNNRVFKEVNYTFLLYPLKPGRLVIPALKVTVRGEVYATDPIEIEVSRQPRQQTSDSNLYVKASISDSHPYESEHIIWTFKLYRAVQTANTRFQPPAFSGFSAKEIEKSKTYSSVINGKTYSISEIRYLLQPLKPGKTTLKPAIVNCDVVHRVNRRRGSGFDSFFNDSFFGHTRLKPVGLQTEPIIIQVKPLPPYEGPVEFSGLVGRFTIKGSLENQEIRENDSTTLSVTVSGNGNITDFNLPDIAIPRGLKAYRDNPEERIRIDETGLNGDKTFRTAVVGIKKGRYELNPVRLCYFDAAEGEYAVIGTPTLTLHVRAADQSEQDKPATAFSVLKGGPPDPVGKGKVRFIGRDILPIKDDVDALLSQKPFSFFLFCLYLFIPFGLFLSAYALSVFFKRPITVQTMMMKRAEKAIQEARRAEVGSDVFYSCLYNALVSSIFSRAGVKGESMTYAEAESILDSTGFTKQEAEQAACLLEQIESAKYSGIDGDSKAAQDLLRTTKMQVKQILSQ